MGEIAHPAEQAAGDARGTAAALGDFLRAVVGDRGIEQTRGAADDLFELGDRIEIEADRDSEAVAQRGGQQPLAGGRADEGEFGEVDADRAGRGTLADHEVECAVLHRRVEDFLDRGGEAVDLVDEQDVAVLEVGQQGGEIARLGDHRARGGAEADPHFAGEDPGERGLAETRRAEEQDMVERLAARLGGVDEDAEVLARRLLADEFVEALGPKRRIGVLGGALGGGESGGISGHAGLGTSQRSRYVPVRFYPPRHFDRNSRRSNAGSLPS